jgi:chromosome segregation ATPase
VVPTKAGPVVAPSAAQNVAPGPEEQGDIYPERAPKTSWRARWAREPAEAKPATARPYRRLFLAGAVVVAVLAATTASTTVAWQRAERDLSLQGQQLTAAQNTLASTRSSLSAQGQGTVALQAELHYSAQQWDRLKAQLAQREDQLSQTKGELGQAQRRLGQEQSELSQAQSRAAQAQGQAGQAQLRAGTAQDLAREAQGQLGHTQVDLSAAQANAALCQQGAALGQQDVQVLSTLVFLENAYLAATQTKERSLMQQDMAQIQAVDAQQQTLGPQFSSSVELCTPGR